MGWRIVEVSNAQTLKLYIDNLLIYCENKKYSISLKDIDVLILDNYQLMLSIQLINKLSENNTVVILCDNRHLPSVTIHREKNHSHNHIYAPMPKNQAFLVINPLANQQIFS